MATLALAAAGTVVGGPFGMAIGFLAGQAIDAGQRSSDGRRGPRLDDLRVQTSSYGSPLAKIWGRMRVAGTVIWADELREDRNRSGGKGQPSTTTYSYSASFAVAISARPVRSVGRIWADGKLLKGAAGDLKTRVAVRLQNGDERQAVDPLIGAAEGAAPAHRGMALLVFEDLALGDFGNRIPSITAEIEAEDENVDPHRVAAELGELRAGPSQVAFTGYAVTGGNHGQAVEELASLTGSAVSAGSDGLRLGDASEPVLLPPATDRVAGAGERIERRAAEMLPDAVEVGYFDPARDYQAGLQRAGTGARVDALAIPAAMSADAAARLAASRLDRAWRTRERRTVALPPEWMGIGPGREVVLPETGGRHWRVVRSRLERMVVHLALEAVAGSGAVAIGSDGGRATPAPDVEEGPLALRLLDPPALPGERVDGPRLLAAVAGARGATLEVSTDGQAWTNAGAAAAPAVLGTVLAAPERQALDIWDRAGLLEVELLDGDMGLESRTEMAVLAGENLAMAGGELIGFTRAEQLDERRWRLSGLLRGQFGTDHAAVVAGDPFTLISADALRAVPLPVARLGGTTAVLAAGRVGEPIEAHSTVTAEAFRPLAPCHLRAERGLDGSVRLSWTRRSREGWAWLDGVDAPLGQERELYRVRVGARVAEVGEPGWTYTAFDQAADGVVGTPLAFAVEQVGALAVSRAATIEI